MAGESIDKLPVEPVELFSWQLRKIVVNAFGLMIKLQKFSSFA